MESFDLEPAAPSSLTQFWKPNISKVKLNIERNLLIFFSFTYIDETGQTFQDWINMVGGLFESMGIEKTDLNTHKTILYNIQQIQTLNMTHCGQFCLSFLKTVDKAKNIQTFLKKSREYTGLFNNYELR